ncbi:hypothetical protein HNP84_006453 [Thermocatellispora tengchongensis]|uniref:DUF6545 domain-containing protein n=1 Tax=Thermocatellispora tengchongensis TaxID=1073253 RepID=A0A840PBS2_9ACTN|nr:MAB_1171c family putative transporter [Thermocatellispora tengchongensis]MBB5136702.1 hypothetical protein [Thermocatellispora tengchongensis]
MSWGVLHISIAALCWLILVVKTVDLIRNPRSRPLRSLIVTCLGLSIALTVGIPPVYASIDRLTQVPNAAKLIQHLATVGASCAVTVMLIHLAPDRPDAAGRARRRIVLAGGVAATMAVLFFLAPVDVSEPLWFADRYSTAPFIPHYMFLFIAVTAVACADIAVAAWRYGRQRRHGANRYLRLGGRLVSAAAAIGVAYCLFKGLYIVARFVDEPPSMEENVISTPLALASVALGAVGLALPKLGRTVEAIHDRLGRVRAYRRLYPLWSALQAAMPEIALNQPRGRELLAVFDIDYRLYRRVIEICDGMLALGMTGWAGHTRLDHRLAAAEASALADALKRNERSGADRTTVQPPVKAGRSLDDEIKWLVMVADAYRRLPSAPAG